MDSRRDLAALGGWLAVQVAMVGALVVLGRSPVLAIPWADLPAWSAVTPPTDVVVATLRLVGLLAASWLLLSTVAYLAMRVANLPRALRILRWVTLPALRRVVDRAVVTAVATSGLAAPVWADAPVLVPPGAPPSGVVQEVVGPEDPPATAAVEPGADLWVVEPGDNLWDVARALLRRSVDDPTDQQVHRAWRALIDANAGRLASGDPDLIHPGEALVLPDEAARAEG